MLSTHLSTISVTIYSTFSLFVCIRSIWYIYGPYDYIPKSWYYIPVRNKYIYIILCNMWGTTVQHVWLLVLGSSTTGYRWSQWKIVLWYNKAQRYLFIIAVLELEKNVAALVTLILAHLSPHNYFGGISVTTCFTAIYYYYYYYETSRSIMLVLYIYTYLRSIIRQPTSSCHVAQSRKCKPYATKEVSAFRLADGFDAYNIHFFAVPWSLLKFSNDKNIINCSNNNDDIPNAHTVILSCPLTSK